LQQHAHANIISPLVAESWRVVRMRRGYLYVASL
jgi:hypothetical protein